MEKITFRAMNCQMAALLDVPAGAAGLLEQVPGWFLAWEKRFSRFIPESELNRLNRHAGQPVMVSREFFSVLQAASRAASASGGLVNPAVLAALETAGYNRSFEDLRPAVGTLAGDWSPQAAPAFSSIRLEAATRTVWLPAGVRLDLGGVVKGWAADRTARRLGCLGPALVDAGGDIAISAPRSGDEPWPVGVADPFDQDATLDVLAMGAGGVATSGREHRRWQDERGRWQHHIIDPRTGRPAQTDVLAVTVAGPTAAAAEMAAKTVLISGALAGLAWLEQRPAFAGLLVLENGQRLESLRWLEYIWRQTA